MSAAAGPPHLEAAYRVRFDEATPEGTARSGALLGYLQDLAWQHSAALGFTRAWYDERSLAWVVRALELEVSASIGDGDEIRVTTRIAGYRKVMARRRSEIMGADGLPAGHALVDWAMTNGRAAVRVPGEFLAVPGVEHGPFVPVRVETGPAPAGAVSLDLVPRLRELDPMGHANNGTYADWLDEAVRAAGGDALATTAPRRYRIEYIRPAVRDARLRSTAWPDGAGYSWSLADAASGDELARGRLERP